MFRSLQMLVAPAAAWEKIATPNRGPVTTFFLYFLPMAILCNGVEAWSLLHLGDLRGQFDHVTPINQTEVTRYETAYGLGLLITLFLGSKLIQAIASSLQLKVNYGDCFKLVAYALAPVCLGRLLDAIPALNTWACWGFGALGCVFILYQGVATVLKPEITKGFAMYLFASFLLFVCSGLTHLSAVAALRGKYEF